MKELKVVNLFAHPGPHGKGLLDQAKGVWPNNAVGFRGKITCSTGVVN